MGMVAGTVCAVSVHAADLDEATLQTVDGTCGIHYLTSKNTQGWSVEITGGTCPNELLNGYADVAVLNAFGQVVDQIYGYFSNGYWTGNQQLNAPVLKRTSDEKGVQKAIFIAGSNKKFRIDYIGQMSAQKNAGGTYNPLSFCGPFRVLAVTQNTGLFDDEQTVQDVIDDATENARLFCPAEKRMMLFASTKMEPKQQDIFFFADVNLQTGEHNIVTKADSKPMVIKQEGGEVVSLVIPERKKTPVLKRGYVDRSREPIASPVRPAVPVTEDVFHPTVDFEDVVSLPVPEMAVASDVTIDELEPSTVTVLETALPMDELPVPETIAEPSPETMVKRSLVAEKMISPIAHLRVMAQVMRQPVTGTAVVHIETVGLDGTAKTDEPAVLTLAGADMRRGWAIAHGVFTFDENGGRVDVTEVFPCIAPMCKDLLP